jgi:hypothetical protein
MTVVLHGFSRLGIDLETGFKIMAMLLFLVQHMLFAIAGLLDKEDAEYCKASLAWRCSSIHPPFY